MSRTHDMGSSRRLPEIGCSHHSPPVNCRNSLYRFAAIPVVALLLAGCASKDVNWDARRGKYTYNEAVQQYGTPIQVEPLPEGGKVGYWTLPDARTYAFKFQLTKFDGNSEGSLNPGKGELPPGGRPLGTVGKPVLQLTFDANDHLTSAVRLKDTPGTNAVTHAASPAPEPAPAESK